MKMQLGLLGLSSLVLLCVSALLPAQDSTSVQERPQRTVLNQDAEPPKRLSPMEEALHWREQYERADAELNAVYEELMASRDAEGQRKLRTSQRAWLVFRDAEGDFVAHDWLGGSGQAAAVNSTLATLTRDRIRQLKERL